VVQDQDAHPPLDLDFVEQGEELGPRWRRQVDAAAVGVEVGPVAAVPVLADGLGGKVLGPVAGVEDQGLVLVRFVAEGANGSQERKSFGKWSTVGTFRASISDRRPVSPAVMRTTGLGAWAAKGDLPHFSAAYRTTRLGRFGDVFVTLASIDMAGSGSGLGGAGGGGPAGQSRTVDPGGKGSRRFLVA
jgi:hypothetical protein